jgi:hypothetical protein
MLSADKDQGDAMADDARGGTGDAGQTASLEVIRLRNGQANGVGVIVRPDGDWLADQGFG